MLAARRLSETQIWTLFIKWSIIFWNLWDLSQQISFKPQQAAKKNGLQYKYFWPNKVSKLSFINFWTNLALLESWSFKTLHANISLWGKSKSFLFLNWFDEKMKLVLIIQMESLQGVCSALCYRIKETLNFFDLCRISIVIVSEWKNDPK